MKQALKKVIKLSVTSRPSSQTIRLYIIALMFFDTHLFPEGPTASHNYCYDRSPAKQTSPPPQHGAV